MPDYEELFNKEKKRCPHTEKVYLIAINELENLLVRRSTSYFCSLRE
jgi:hypothetical protein